VAKKKQKPEKARPGAEKQLKGAVKKLESRLAAAEKAAEKWKAKAQQHQAAAVKWKDRARKRASAPAATPADRATVVPPGASTTPDDTWNVTRLRAEARGRGVAGYSRKTKEQLLAELRG
jgi:hypothetical protein